MLLGSTALERIVAGGSTSTTENGKKTVKENLNPEEKKVILSCTGG